MQPATSPEVILRTERLSRAVGAKQLVDGISVSVNRGETLAIVGPSGSGKSSFLRLLNRLDEPTEGAVYLDGHDYRSLEPRVLRRQVGMVFQSPNLFPGRVADNLRFGPRQRGDDVSDAAVAELLERVNLPDYAGRDVSTLSGGEAQRVSIARTLANHPRVLLLDEPTSALDDVAKHNVEALIAEIAANTELTVLIVTHDLKQAARLADRVMVINQGRMARLGPADEVLNAASAIV